jgi:hypothetical protein
VACIFAHFTIFALTALALTGEAGLSAAKAKVDKRKTTPTIYNKAFFMMTYLHNISATHNRNLYANKVT